MSGKVLNRLLPYFILPIGKTKIKAKSLNFKHKIDTLPLHFI
jgi:hypothetical protein